MPRSGMTPPPMNDSVNLRPRSALRHGHLRQAPSKERPGGGQCLQLPEPGNPISPAQAIRCRMPVAFPLNRRHGR